MEKKKRAFRFPVFDDRTGAKLEKEVTSFSSEPSISRSVPYIERKKVSMEKANDPEEKTFFRRGDKPKIDEKLEDELVRERLKKGNESLVIMDEEVDTPDETPFPERNNSNEFTRGESVVKQSIPEQRKSFKKSDYRSFSNVVDSTEPINEDGTLSEVERIPQVKKNMQRSRESMQDAVPFRRKQKERHKKS